MTAPRPMNMLCMAKPEVRWPSGRMSATKARKGSMLTLMEASRIQSMPAAIHRAELLGMKRSIERSENCADEEIRTAPAEPAPGAVARVADDGLNQHAGERSGQPQDGDLVGACAEIFIDGAHVGHLQAPAKLDAEEAEAHVPYLPKAALRLAEMHDVALRCGGSIGQRRSAFRCLDAGYRR